MPLNHPESLVGMPAGILAFGGLFDPTSWTTVAKAVGCGRRESGTSSTDLLPHVEFGSTRCN